ncbi:hypothetical protein L484_022785 [Morus notabilis]|uniref:Uncharacterized protein n=1 Tax=Morus notabilis TaxID=981085 RepID=W9SD48_9ROSA|nr:hypothetical protein L484_022785 [Morus notabilis]
MKLPTVLNIGCPLTTKKSTSDQKYSSFASVFAFFTNSTAWSKSFGTNLRPWRLQPGGIDGAFSPFAINAIVFKNWTSPNASEIV